MDGLLNQVFCAGKTLVSADFCQLELRLLAHFSQEPALHLAFSRPGDVFIAIASEWNSVPVDQVITKWFFSFHIRASLWFKNKAVRTIRENFGFASRIEILTSTCKAEALAMSTEKLLLQYDDGGSRNQYLLGFAFFGVMKGLIRNCIEGRYS